MTLNKVQYNTKEQREQILQYNSNLYLIEEQNILDGNFLIFAEEPRPVVPIYEDVSKTELELLQSKIDLMQQALDELLLGGI